MLAQVGEYEIVGKFRSLRSGEVYVVTRHLADGALSCTCQGRRFHRPCEHVAYAYSHPYAELSTLPMAQEARVMDCGGRNIEARAQWALAHLEEVVL
jgi:hypothetical protein